MTHELAAPLGRERIRRIYDRIGRRYDLLRVAEAAPKRAALALLAVQPGERVLEAGVGTGNVTVALAQATAAPGDAALGARGRGGPSAAKGAPSAAPLVAGVDLSPRMVELARERAQAAGLGVVVALREGDACALPYPDASFDAAFSSYVLDLLPAAEIAQALGELRRVLRPGGRLALVALAPGRGLGARLFTVAYEALYRVSPAALGGCRPIALAGHVTAAGFVIRAQRSFFRVHPSDVVLVEKPTDTE